MERNLEILANVILMELWDGSSKISLGLLIAQTQISEASLTRMLSGTFFTFSNEVFHYNFPKGHILDFAVGQGKYRLEWDLSIDFLIRYFRVNTTGWVGDEPSEIGQKRLNELARTEIYFAIRTTREREKTWPNLRVMRSALVVQTLYHILTETAKAKGCERMLTAPLTELANYKPRPDGPSRSFKGRRPAVKGDL